MLNESRISEKMLGLMESGFFGVLKESYNYQNILNKFTEGDLDYRFDYYDDNYESKSNLCKIVYIRFGLPRKDENGNWLTSQKYYI